MDERNLSDLSCGARLRGDPCETLTRGYHPSHHEQLILRAGEMGFQVNIKNPDSHLIFIMRLILCVTYVL